MITSKSLRWSGAAVSNGRQRLTACPRGPRFYSFTSSRTSLLKSHTIRSRQQPIHQSSVEQVRLISLWGWGSSSPKQAEFAKVHSPQSTSLPDAAVGHDGQILAQRDTPSSHSVPAIHQTSDIPPPTPASPDPQPILPDVTSSPLDHSTFEDVPPTDVLDPADALSAITERIGYLKEVCGIDFGWGPSSMMQWILEHIHIYGDMSWATSIVLLAVFARLVIFFPMIKSSDMGAKWKATQPILGPVRSKVQAAYKAGDHAKMAEAKAELNAIQKEYGVNPVKMFVPILVQVPLQFGGFRVLRNMAELPVPALEKENWLWAQDLTLSDPFLILPVASAAITYLTIKRGGETGTAQLQGGLMVTLSYIMPCASFIFMSFQPGTVQLYFFVSALLAFSQSRLLTNTFFRKFMGLHPTVPTPKNLAAPTATAGASSGSKNANAAPAANTTATPGIGPAGLKLYQSPPLHPTSTSSSQTAAAKSSGISIIDKLVNRAKTNLTEAKEGWYSVLGTTKEKKIKQAERDRLVSRAEDYERRIVREEDWRREERNRKRNEHESGRRRAAGLESEGKESGGGGGGVKRKKKSRV